MSSLLDKLTLFANDWSNDEKLLKDFIKNYSLPTIAKVKKGQYSSLGVSKKLQNIVYIHSVYPSQCVVAESQFSGKNKSVFAVPLTYKGWFDILSEDRKQVKPITNTNELSNFVSKLFLIRENTKVISDSTTEPQSKNRELEVGEILEFDGIRESTKFSKLKKLIAFKDSHNKEILLESGQRIVCSPISQNNEIEGVHTIRNLVDKFRFPITVQLAYGEIFSSTKFRPILRLIGLCDLQFAIVIPLKSDYQVLSIPISESLVLSPLRSVMNYSNTEDFVKVKKFANKVEPVQQKTISLVTSGNVKIFKQDFSEKNDKLLVSMDNSDLAVYEEVEEIYRYIREGGELPSPMTKERDKKTSNTIYEIVSPIQKPMDAIEREIWDEPIYADISKLKTQKMSKKKDRSHDSELANIGMENEIKPDQEKVDSTFKRTVQRFKNKNTTMSMAQGRVLGNKSSNLITTQNHSSKKETVRSKENNLPKNEISTWVFTGESSNDGILENKPNKEISLNKKKEQTNYHGSSTVPPMSFNETMNCKHEQFSDNFKITQHEPLQGPLSQENCAVTIPCRLTKDGQQYHNNNDKTAVDDTGGIQQDGNIWNVSVLPDENDGDSKKTRVIINFNSHVNNFDKNGVTVSDMATTFEKNSPDGQIQKSDDDSTLTFTKVIQNDDTMSHVSKHFHSQNTEFETNNVNNQSEVTPTKVDEYSGVISPIPRHSTTFPTTTVNSETCNGKTVINLRAEDTKFYDNPDVSSTISRQYWTDTNKLSSNEQNGFAFNSDLQPSIENQNVKSHNVSTITLKSANSVLHYPETNRTGIEQFNQKQDDAQTIKVNCNKSPDYSFGTVSSKTFLRTGGSTISNNHDRFATPSEFNAANEPVVGRYFGNVTTIRVDKKKCLQQNVASTISTAEQISDQQVVQKSPFGNTQIYIRQTFATKPNFNCTKFHVNGNFY